MELDAYHALADALLAERTKEAAADRFEAAIVDRRYKMQLAVQAPSIGRVVLYLDPDKHKLLPALIVEVLDHETFEARVVVFGKPDPGMNSQTYYPAMYFDATYDAPGTKPGCYSWPPRV